MEAWTNDSCGGGSRSRPGCGEKGGARRRGDRPEGRILPGGTTSRSEKRSDRARGDRRHPYSGPKAGNYRLTDCDLYVTIEPCAMCLGGVILARLRRLVFGADDPKAGAVRSIVEFPVEKTTTGSKLTAEFWPAKAPVFSRIF